MKKLLSVLIASACVVSVLPVSSSSASFYITGHEEVLDDMIEIPDDVTIYDIYAKEDCHSFYNYSPYPEENIYGATYYLSTYEDGYYDRFVYIKEYKTGLLRYSLAEGKTKDDIKTALSEYNSENGCNLGTTWRYDGSITDMKTDFQDFKDARGIAEYLKENGYITSCEFIGKDVLFPMGTSYPTSYQYSPETEELLTSYVEEKGLDVYITRDPSIYDDRYPAWFYDEKNQEYYPPVRIYLIPKERISDLELLRLAQQVYDDTGLLTSYGEERVNSIARDYYVRYSYTVDMFDYEEGDANNDTSVNMADAVMVMQSLANPDVYGIGKPDGITEQGMFNADICDTGDGVTLSDAETIQLRLLGL